MESGWWEAKIWGLEFMRTSSFFFSRGDLCSFLDCLLLLTYLWHFPFIDRPKKKMIRFWKMPFLTLKKSHYRLPIFENMEKEKPIHYFISIKRVYFRDFTLYNKLLHVGIKRQEDNETRDYFSSFVNGRFVFKEVIEKKSTRLL